MRGRRNLVSLTRREGVKPFIMAEIGDPLPTRFNDEIPYSELLSADKRIVANPEAPGFIFPLFGVINPNPRTGSDL